MKSINKLFAIIILASISLAGCQKVPTASFSSDKESYVNGETMYLTNTSQNASSYQWSFSGSSTKITTKDAYVTFTGAGQYTVNLTAISRNGKKSDEVTKTITIEKANGSCIFYTKTQGLGAINISVDGVPLGSITLIYTGAPDCGANGCVNATIKEGTHTITATATGTGQVVSGTIDVSPNACNQFEM